MKTSCRMPLDMLLLFRFFFFFFSFFVVFQEKLWNKLVIDSFIFYSMVGKYKQLRDNSVEYVRKNQVIWKYMLFRSTITGKEGKVTSFSPDVWIFNCCAFWIMDGVICAIYLALITVVAEIVIEQTATHMWLKSFKSGCRFWDKINS